MKNCFQICSNYLIELIFCIYVQMIFIYQFLFKKFLSFEKKFWFLIVTNGNTGWKMNTRIFQINGTWFGNIHKCSIPIQMKHIPTINYGITRVPQNHVPFNWKISSFIFCQCCHFVKIKRQKIIFSKQRLFLNKNW